MLHELRRLAPRALDAEHVAVELRSPELRLAVHRGRNVSSDYALLAKASPFLASAARSSGLTLVLEGAARFDDRGKHAWLAAGDFAAVELSRPITEAHAGTRSRVLLLEWEHDVLGGRRSEVLEVHRLGRRDRERLAALATELERTPSAKVGEGILDVLRAAGLPFERLSAADLDRHPTSARDQAVADGVARSLSRLEDLPAIDEIGEALRMHTRTLHRQLDAIAEAYLLAFSHWRSALHAARVLAALRMLAAPGATTEHVARLAGFRSPVALCHTFAEAGLPSPGVLAKAARRDVLASWAE